MPRQNQEYRELFEDAEGYPQTMLAPKLPFTVLHTVLTFISAEHIHYSALWQISGRLWLSHLISINLFFTKILPVGA